MSNTGKAVFVILAAAAIGAAGYTVMDSQAEPAAVRPVRTAGASVAGYEADGQEAAAPRVIVYKTATCGCCAGWADYLKGHGFEVKTEDVADLTAVKVELGVPPQLQSCHTAVIDGYLVEGHVPIEPIQRMLEERPEIAGIAVPGMPIGSPGMEVPGRPADSYDIVAFDREGNTTVYDSR